MAVERVFGFIAAVSSKTAGTTLAITNGGGTASGVGPRCVLSIVCDNPASVTAPTITFTGNGGGITGWTLLAGPTGSGVTTTAGSGIWVWTYLSTPVTSSIAGAGGAITTVTFSASVVARAASLIGFIGLSGSVVGTAGTGASATGVATATTSGTVPAVGDLVFGSFGYEGPPASAADADTVGGAWFTTVQTGTTGGSAVTNVTVGQQYKILTAAGAQTYDPAGMSADSVSQVVAVQAAPEPAITQAAYRFYADGTESASVALAAQDTAYTADLSAADANLLLRTRLQSTDTGNLSATDDYRLQVEKNASGVWSNVDAGSVAGFTGKVSSVSTTGWATVGEAAQSFLGDGRKLVRAGFWLQKNGSPPGNVIVRLYAHTGTYGTSTGIPTGSPLATSPSSVVASSLPTGGLGEWFFFDFDGTFTMAAGTAYCMVVTTDTLGDTNNDVWVGYTSAGYEGNAATRPPAGAWTANTGQDFLLRVQSTPDALADGYDQSNADSSGGPVAAGQIVGQSFLGDGKALTRAGFWMSRAGAATSTLTAVLYAHTGTYGAGGTGTGAVLATSTSSKAAGALQLTTPQWEDFAFDGTFTLAAGTPYVIGLTPDVAVTGVIQMWTDGSSPTHPGQKQNFNSGTGTWAGLSGDSIFRVFTAPSATLPYDTDTNLRDADPTTNRLGAGTGSFTAGRIAKNGQADDFAMVSSNYTELLYALTLKQAALANGDTLRFRVLRNGATTGLTYTQVPTVPISLPPPVTVTQASYRFYADGTETGSVALGAQDTTYTADLTAGDVGLLLRTRLQSTSATSSPATDDWQLQWEKNASGTWTDLAGAAAPVLYRDSTGLVSGAATTNRLGAGVGTFTAGEIAEFGLVSDLGWNGNDYTELLYSFILKQALLANSDTIRFRVLRNGSTTGFTYTQVPTISVNITVTRTGQPKVWTGSAFVNKPAKVWTGSAWVQKPVKVWSGSAWVLVK